MLRGFRLTNHRSFRDEHELLLMPAYDNKRDVVPVAAVYGANASGKSNLLDGLWVMSDLVRGWRTQDPGSGIARSPFRLDSKSLLDPSSFAVELVLDGVRYIYGFTVDDTRVISEWLLAYPRNRKRVLFERDDSSIGFGSTVMQQKRAEVIKDLVTDDTLLLAVVARLKLAQYQPVADWFRRSLVFVRPSPGRADERLAQFIEQSGMNRAKFLDLARAADIGISDIIVDHVVVPEFLAQAELMERMAADLEARISIAVDDDTPDLEERMMRARMQAVHMRERSQRARLLLLHGGVGFELSDESEGIRLWLDLLPEVLTSLGSGRTLVIDEIDTSLHPLLVRKLVALFRDPQVNTGRAQLLFTTHDAFLLAPVAGEAGLDRDQVWFVEKHADGASELYPLTDFKPRNEHNLARRYLGGAYGAVPILDGFDALGWHVATDNAR